MLSVACVLRSGGPYDWSWVAKLRDGVRRHLPVPYRFVCLSDLPDPLPGIEVIKLAHDWPGYWSKVELFRPGLFRGPVLYLDLDSLIVGPLDPLIKTSGFWMVSDFLGHHRGWKNSCVMAWNGDRSAIYEAMARDPQAVIDGYAPGKRTDGRWTDQAYIEDMAPDAETFPVPLVASYRIASKGGPPVGARVIQFHGNPKPHTIKKGWVAELWQ